MAVNERRIAVLGAGKIGEALISGLLSSGWRTPGRHRRLEPAGRARRPSSHERHGIVATLSNDEAVIGAALVVIAVKPQDIESLLGEIGHLIADDQTILSIAAAIPTATIERHLAPGVPVVRAMPNTPSVVHEGVAGLCAGAHADDAHVTLAEEALAHLGAVVRVPEKLMDAVTAVSGSGPAYFALLAEAMIEAGLLLGLSREISTQLVVQTMLGTAQQMRDLKMHPVELREMVTSPGGTTIAAIRELEIAGVRAAFLNAIQAAMVRSRELAAGDDAAERADAWRQAPGVDEGAGKGTVRPRFSDPRAGGSKTRDVAADIEHRAAEETRHGAVNPAAMAPRRRPHRRT